jgi:hypothetical protein
MQSFLGSAPSKPSAPTIGTATATAYNQATISFTAPANNGGSAITSYTAVSSPGGITGTLSQSGSGTITVNGLSESTSYTFTVYATNAVGNSSNSSASNSITTPANIVAGNSGILTTITYNQNQWYHLTYVSEFVTGTTHRLKLYVNGGIAHSSVATNINLTNAPLRIGMDMSGFGMSGQIARVNFYDKALSDKEILKTYVNYRSRFGL